MDSFEKYGKLNASHNHRHIPYTKAPLLGFLGTVIFGFGLMIVFSTNAYSWGWSRSPGQGSPPSTSTDDKSAEISSDQPNLESAINEMPNQDTDTNAPVSSDQNVSETNATYEPVSNDTEESDALHDQSNPSVWKRTKRKNLLVKKWRAEKSRKDIFYVTTDEPLNIPDVKFQLDRIQAGIPAHPENQLPYKGSDLALVEEWINDAIDRRIPQKSKSENFKSAQSISPVLNNTDVLKKIDNLEKKRDMLVYGNNALQAMGIFID